MRARRGSHSLGCLIHKEIDMNAPKLIRYLLVGILAIIVLAPQASASQAPPDASTLNPPPLPFMSCKRVGSGTSCDGERTIHEDNVDTGITCGSGPEAFNPVDQSFANERFSFIYNSAGDLTGITVHTKWYSAQWVNLQSGTTLPYTQEDYFDLALAVPGDISSATVTHTGQSRFKPLDGPPIFINAGRTVTAPDGTLEFRAGPQSFLDLFVDGDTSVLEPLCAALQ